MKKYYLILAIIGFLLPNYLVLLESVQTGNILLYSNPLATMEGMFANRISTIFTIDLLFGVFVFFIWTYQESKEESRRALIYIWMITLLFGFACGLPLFLYLRASSSSEKKPDNRTD